ncbi:hypothetical protein [Microbacterium lacticum]
MLCVGVVVIDWTLTGESLPTPTEPTLIWRVLRRGVRTSGTRGIPRFTAGTPSAYAAHAGGRLDAADPSRRTVSDATVFCYRDGMFTSTSWWPTR